MNPKAESIRLRPDDLAEALELVDVLFDTDPSGIFIYSQDGRLVECNRAACEMHGFAKEEMLGMEPRDFIHPDGYQTFLDFQAELQATGSFQGESCGLTATGGKFDVEVFGKPVMIAGTGYLYSVIRDITDAKTYLSKLEEHEKQLEVTVAERTAELKRSNAKLEQFAYLTSHDLQEPLRTIRSFSGVLKEDYGDQLDGEGVMALTFIEESAARMSRMVTDLLEHSRLGSESEVEEVDLNLLLADVLADMGTRIREAKAEVTVAPLPTLHGRRPALRILFQNLISNAIKFARADVVPHVEVEASSSDDGWLFSVSDNGIGIAPGDHEKVFQVFKRVHKRSKYEGSGIGLAHCAKVVELHGGTIHVASDVNQGATFTFLLRSLA